MISLQPGPKFRLFLNLLLLVAVTTGCAIQPDQNKPRAAGSTIPLTACQLTSMGMSYAISARCGTLAVFEDQAHKSGRKIDLNIAVIPAVSKNPEADALFLLAGGPGEAATEAYPQLIPILERLHQKRDIVLVDQRGTGKSNPLRCPTPGHDTPVGEGEAESQQAADLKSCQAGLKADTRLYTTPAFVEDLDQVRAALGYPLVDLVGISYGTRVAQAYQRQYAQYTRTVTLDSVNPLDWSLGPDNSANAQHALDLVFSRCAADAGCKAAFPNLAADFSALMAKLEKQPVEVTLTHPTTGEVTSLKLSASMAATTIQILSYTPESVSFVPLLIHQTMERSDYSLMAAQYLIVMGGLGQSINEGLYLSVICAEDAPFYPTAPVKVTSYLPDHTGDMLRQCAAWQHTAVSTDFKAPVRSDIPTLLLSGEADPITPPSNAEKAAAYLSNSLHLVVPGIGHNVIYRGCVPRILTTFIENGSLAGLDTSCIQQIRPAPFMLNFSGSQP